jgi:hypothetical protein
MHKPIIILLINIPLILFEPPEFSGGFLFNNIWRYKLILNG